MGKIAYGEENMPERIWAGDFDESGFGHCVIGRQGGLYEEYVRADLASPAPSLPEGVERVVEPCACHRCHKPVAYDLIISDDDWAKIAPKSVDGWKGGGILCPDCIYAALSSQLAEVRAERGHWQKLHDDRTRFLGDAEADRDRLAAENERLREICRMLRDSYEPRTGAYALGELHQARESARAALASLEERG